MKYLAIIFLLGFISCTDSKNTNESSKDNVETNQQHKSEPPFVKEGELIFTKTGTDTIKHMSIEIAEKEMEQMQGLMYRTSMPDTCAMLFVFDRDEPRSFWMRNTIMPLDIIYVDSKNTIVTIQPNTEPFSEKSIPSYKPAKFVVEVNAGFCNRYSVKEGDKIRYIKSK